MTRPTGTTGLLGGAFDPPHYGHLALAEAAIAHFALDQLVVVPTGNPPHKGVEADAEVRCRLAGAAFAGHPEICLSRFELDREGPSYSIETARWAAERWGDVVFLVGADEFAEFLTWREPEAIVALVRVGVATRPGYPRSRRDPVLAALARRDRVELFEIPAWPISSSEIRALAARGEPIDELVPPAVAALVAKLGLYRGVDVTGCGVH
jgi:nicotinate-nucleotide adenylyltransferase